MLTHTCTYTYVCTYAHACAGADKQMGTYNRYKPAVHICAALTSIDTNWHKHTLHTYRNTCVRAHKYNRIRPISLSLAFTQSRNNTRASARTTEDQAPIEAVHKLVVKIGVIGLQAIEKLIGLALHWAMLADNLLCTWTQLCIAPPQRRHVQDAGQVFFRAIQNPVLRDTVRA